MARKIRANTNPRQQVRLTRKIRIKKKLVLQKGKTARLVVYRSNKFLYAQIVDDLAGATLCQANTREKDFPSKSKKNLESAKTLGQLIGKRAIEKKLEKVVFDRNGYDFHGRIKAVADGAREAGLNF
jgi:large subunit ribosomal protein L18